MPALVTPFTSRGGIDLDAHAHNVDTLWGRGLRGFLVGGSTGEGPYLEPGERRSLVEFARQARRRAHVVCGVAAESLRGALAQVEEAAEGGADAVLVQTPTSLLRRRPDAVEPFFTDVADRSPLPVLLYSVPAVTAYELPTAAAIALSQHDNVVGMKDSGGNAVRAVDIAGRAAAGFRLHVGASAALALSIGGGAFGAITASANYAPGLNIAVVNAARRSARSAAAHQAVLTELSATIERRGLGAVKAAAEAIGLRAGVPRRPMPRATSADRKAVSAALRSAGAL
jgi:4-hydroxy-2-oxoglutarate aldolase